MAIEVKTYEKNPPRIEVIKVTRTNYNEVAEHVGAKRVTVSQGELEVIQTVTLHFANDADADPLIFKIPADFTTPWEAYIQRDVAAKDSKWALIRQYDLSFGYFELDTETTK